LVAGTAASARDCHSLARSPFSPRSTLTTQSTYCETIRDHCATIGRNVHVVNLGESACAVHALSRRRRRIAFALSHDSSLSQTPPLRTACTPSPSMCGT